MLNSQDSLIIANILMAIGTLALALFSLWQTLITRDTARRTIRAYVGIHGGGIQLLSNGMVQINVEYINKGNSPAYVFSTWLKAKVDVAGSIPFDEESPASDQRSNSICLPGAAAHSAVTLNISPQEVSDIRAGNKVLFVWGGANYKDAFKKKRYFKLRSVAAVNGGTVWAIQPHKIGYLAN